GVRLSLDRDDVGRSGYSVFTLADDMPNERMQHTPRSRTVRRPCCPAVPSAHRVISSTLTDCVAVNDRSDGAERSSYAGSRPARLSRLATRLRRTTSNF